MSLHSPITVDLCQGSALRGRRRSSIRPQTFLPNIPFASGASPLAQDESAILLDDASPPETPHLPTTAHTSFQTSSFSTSRHHDEVTLATPKTSSTVTAVGDSYFESKIPSRDSRLRWRLASALFQYFLNGWGDGVTGTALPYFREEFHLTYMTSSLLFVGTMCGFCLGTLFVGNIVQFLGRVDVSQKTLRLQPLSPLRSIRVFKPNSKHSLLGFSACQARFFVLILASFAAPTTFVMMGSRSGLPVMFVAYVIISFARAVCTAPLNVFLSEMPSKPLGYAFGVWGIGAVVSPLIFQATAAAGLPWAHFYFGSIVLAAANLTFLAITFMPTTQELATDHKNAIALLTTPNASPSINESKRPLRAVAALPYQWAISFFSLFYCGTETITQGLIVQYLLDQRNADSHTVGYVTSGFWLGISISRVLWSYFSPRISFVRRKYIIQVCMYVVPSLAILRLIRLGLAMHLLIWFINSTVENGFSASIIGLVWGPIFPACLELANDLLPVELNLYSMAIISAAGSVGSAILPFMTGVVTTKYSMKVWPYICVLLTSGLFGAWLLFPTRQPQTRSVSANKES
ncbi:MFS domain-containing protein [Mycena kentingensis (nom. inval.)]|nr:MFS domain-containing protein [Mycena kentingensis (nom. inval.)]